MPVVGGGLNGQEVLLQRQIQERDLGACPCPLFLDQTEAQRAEKMFWRPPPTPPPPFISGSQGLDAVLIEAGENPWPLHLSRQA